MQLSSEQYEKIIDVCVKALLFYHDEEEWEDSPEIFIDDAGATAKCALFAVDRMRREYQQNNMMDSLTIEEE